MGWRLLLCLWSVTVFAEPLHFSLQLPGLQLHQTKDGFTEVSVTDFFPFGQPGAPSLLQTGTLFLVPEGFAPKLHIKREDKSVIDHVLIAPRQFRSRCQCEPRFEFNSQLYGSDQFFPEQNVRLEEVGHYGKNRLMRLALYPLQVRSQSRELIVTKTIEGFIENATPFDDASPKVDGHLLWFLVGDAYLKTIEPLVQLKNKQGLRTRVIPMSVAGSTNVEIKKTIQNDYDHAEEKPSYFIFVGNNNTMPGFKEVTSDIARDAASDFRYSLLSGDDNLPDVAYGRILGDNEEEIKLQVDRIIEYETDRDEVWYSNALTIASKFGGSGGETSDEKSADQVGTIQTASGYKNVFNLREKQKTALAQNVFDDLLRGVGWITYFGHGAGYAWESVHADATSEATYFTTDQVDALSNEGKLPVVIDVACLNASWIDPIYDENNHERPLFGKRWVTHTHNGKSSGAVAFLGASVSTSWDPPAVMAVGIAKAVNEKGIHSLGDAYLAGQLYLIEKMGTGDDVLDNLKWYNLFGDPSMVVKSTYREAGVEPVLALSPE